MVVPGAMLGFAGDMDRDTSVAGGGGDTLPVRHPIGMIQRNIIIEIVLNNALAALFIFHYPHL
jgi:hypothetical protein